MTPHSRSDAREDAALGGGADAPVAGGVAGDGSVFGLPYRWVAMGVVLFGTFMVVLDTTVVNLGLSSLQREFDTITGIEWVVTSYLAAVGVSQMLSGWAADKFGRKQIFVFALGLFTASSALCAAAPTLELLVGARVIQGIAGGLMTPVAMAMIYELFEPHERGKALGYFGIAVMAAPAIGPVLGGSLVDSVGWRWLFLMNIPIGVLGFPIAMRLLRDTGFRNPRHLDRGALIVSSVGLASLLIGFSQAESRGWSSPVVVGMVALGVVLLAVFVRSAMGEDEPLVEVGLLTNPIFASGMVVIALLTVAQYTRLVYIPLELGTVREIGAFRIGLTMLPSALGIAMTMPIGGRMADRVGSRLPVTLGAGILGASFVALTRLTPTTSLPVIAFILFIGGLGSGLAMMAPNIVAMNAVDTAKVSQASAVSQTVRQVAAAIGVAIVASIFAATRPDAAASAVEALDPYSTVFWVATGLLALTVIVAQFIPGRTVALQLQADRAADMEALGLTGTNAAPTPIDH